MKFIILKILVIIGMAAGLTACATPLSSNTYSSRGASQIQQVAPGVIVSSRAVEVSDDENYVGTAAGAALGGIAAASLIGQGGGSIAAGVGGAVLGGIAGNKIEKQINKQTAVEYVVKLKNGSMVSVVQGTDQIFQPGQPVYVQYGGGRPRIVAR